MIDHTNKVFGLWTVLNFWGRDVTYEGMWVCRCICGAKSIVRGSRLTKGRSQGCNKCTHVKHGQHKSALYSVWKGMKSRCLNPKSLKWPNYGGRGITVCDTWLDFVNFQLDMGDSYSPGLTLERVDNSKGYSPENCVWASQKEQAVNRRSNHLLEFEGETKALSEWAEYLGMKYSTLYSRISSGWGVPKALTTPVGRRK